MNKLIAAVFVCGLIFLLASPTQAGSAIWDLNPGSGHWNAAANWTPASVPNGPTDTAAFGLSTMTSVFLSANTEVDSIVFNSSASAYTITASPTFTLTISGAGISNNSVITQNFVADVDGAGHSGTIEFANSATAGSSMAFSANGALVGDATGAKGGFISFLNSSSAGTSTFTLKGGATSAGDGGRAAFYNSSNAANAVFTVNGGAVNGGNGAVAEFYDSSIAGHATFTNNGGSFFELGGFGGQTIFHDGSSAADAAISNNGGTAIAAGGSFTQFLNSSTAGNAMIRNNGGAANLALGAATVFADTSSADNATLVNNGATVSGAYGGATVFSFNSTADKATLIANGGLGGARVARFCLVSIPPAEQHASRFLAMATWTSAVTTRRA